MYKSFKRILLYSDINNEYIYNIFNNINVKSIIFYLKNDNISNILFIKGIKSIEILDEDISEYTIKQIKPDLIISNKVIPYNIRDIYKYIIYEDKVYCGNCNKYIEDTNNNKEINKICSDECGFQDNIELLKLYNESNVENQQEKIRKISSEKKLDFTIELTDKEKKAQRIALMEVRRHEYIQKREEFKRNMRKASSSTSIKTKKDSDNIKVCMCKAKTKDGKACSNKALRNSSYCGIVSHKKLDPDYTEKVKKISTNKTLERLKKISKQPIYQNLLEENDF